MTEIQTAINRPYDRTSFVLVVDDDNSLLKFFKIHLNKFFSRVIVVENAAQAMKELDEKQIDLVISDVRMPKVDGMQLMKKVRKIDPSIPVLLISGEILSDDQEERLEEADGFLKKPFSIDELHDFMRKGMQLRESFVELYGLIKEKSNFRKLIQGKVTVERQFSKGDRSRVQELMKFLKVS